MGNMPPPADLGGNVSGLELRRTSSRNESHRLDALHAAIEESHFSNSSIPDIVMPWEMPALSMVFGGAEEPIVPSVRPILGYVEPAQLESPADRPPLSVQ